MPRQRKDHGILERLPPELQYLKQVAWDGWKAMQKSDKALQDNVKYFRRVAATMQQHFHDLPFAEQLTEALRHQELIAKFTKRFPFDDYPETGPLLFICAALTYPGVLFKNPNA